MQPSTAFLWLIATPLAASPLIYLAGRLIIRRHGERETPNPVCWLTLFALLATGVPLYAAGSAYLAHGPLTLTIHAITLRFDGISLLLAAVTLTLSAFVALFSATYIAKEVGEEKYYAMLSAMSGAIIGLGCAGDLFNLWVWFETMAVTSYLLVIFYRQQAASLEAGVKYIVQNVAGSALVLLGIALVFAQTGSLDLAEIRLAVQQPSPLLTAAGALFIAGFGVKTALVPLHTWLPDAHSQAPSGVSALLSGVLIEAGLIAMLRVLGAIAASSSAWGALLLGFGALNMLLGNLMALRQTQVKRLLAFSSISHVGYMLLGLGTALAFNLPNGAAGGFFHLITHALMKGLAFLAAGALLYALHLARRDHGPLIVEDLNGAAQRYPLAAFALSLAVLGLGGLPPLAGFMSKWQIFVAGFESQNAILWLLVIFAALNSLLSLGYYAPLVNRMYRNSPSSLVENGGRLPVSMMIPLALLALAVAALGFWPSLASWLTNPAAASLLASF